jgi:hypothetical protein
VGKAYFNEKIFAMPFSGLRYKLSGFRRMASEIAFKVVLWALFYTIMIKNIKMF